MSVELEWWGTDVPYEASWERQHARRDALIAGEGTPCLALLEHRSVITTGRRPVDLSGLEDIDTFRAERGGLATWHGPGQLVGYLLCDVWALGLGAKSTVCAVENGLMAWLRSFDVEPARRTGFPGVWLEGRKVAAVGMHFRRGHSMHGFSLNLTVDDAPWDRFQPCGITDAGVVSLHELRQDAPSPEAAADPVGKCVLAALGVGG